MCTRVRRDVSACEWGGMLAGTFVYRHGPRSGGSEHGSRIVDRICQQDLRSRFSAAVSQANVRP